MSKKLLVSLLVFGAILALPTMSLAETTTRVTPLGNPTLTAEQIATLNQLYTQIAVLQEQLRQLQAQASGLAAELRLTKKLYKGTSDEEVKTLQKLLATDSEIYPEGLVTGYYGPLTEKAVRKMQRKAGLSETGQIDDVTVARINQILREGAGKSGKIPPGLLRAPGIMKKLGISSTTTPHDNDDDDDDSDDDDDDNNSSPTISNVVVSGTMASTTVISWQTNEPTTGKVHYALTTPVAGQGGGLVVFDNTLGTTSAVTLSNLSASTTYYYYIKVQDGDSNSALTPDAFFTTAGN